MPLIKSKSKKAFEENMKAEMHAGKPKDQSLAIAYAVKRKAGKKKKMAQGGNTDADADTIVIPDKGYGKIIRTGMAEGGNVNDQDEIRRNSGDKPAHNDNWLDQPTVEQARRPSKVALKHPKMVPSNAFSVRMRDEEDHLESSASPGPYGEQPPKHDNEDGPKRQGPAVSDMQDEHSTRRKPYAKGGEIEASDERHPLDGPYEDDLLDLPPSEDEAAAMAHHDNEEGPDRQGDDVPDMQREHSNGRKPYAEGGNVEDMTEEEEEHHMSIAAAIMANRDRRAKAGSDSGSPDEEHAERGMYAEGGRILSHGSMDSDDSSQADLSRNADEDANEEDQASFNALRKENYSESAGLRQLDNPRDSAEHGDQREDDEENKLDMVSQIRSKMNVRRQFR